MKSIKYSSLLFLAASLAAGAAAAADTTGYVKITQTKAWTNDDFHVNMEDVAAGRQTCGNNFEFRLAKAQGEIFRSLTAAQLSGRPVQLQYSCTGTVAYISGFRML